MSYLNRSGSLRFHGSFEPDYPAIAISPNEAVVMAIPERVEYKRILRCRFHLHQHPYAGALVQRALQEGIEGVFAADTETTSDGRSRPGSIQVSLPGSTGCFLVQGTKGSLVEDSIAGYSSRPVSLKSGTHFELSAKRSYKLFPSREINARLISGQSLEVDETGEATLSRRERAFAQSQIEMLVSEPLPVRLHDGKNTLLHTGTRIMLLVGELLELETGSRVTVLRRESRAYFFDEFFESAYKPEPYYVTAPFPAKDIDFRYSGAYSSYNWELFFHAPFSFAKHLSRGQRYQEAQQWFHCIFDPTDDSEDEAGARRFWKLRPFRTVEATSLESMLANLATEQDPELRDDTLNAIQAWSRSPFRPHRVAAYRHQAYMIATVMAYLDNLIDWGDSLFRQDTGEAIDEAMQLYVLAASVLGPRPESVPRKGSTRHQSYAKIRSDVAQFGSVLREVESLLPFDLMPASKESVRSSGKTRSLASLGEAMYFGVPNNEKLLGYWDKVSDRMFKIRNSLNFKGVFRTLKLFEPPIDPAMLARAAAAGLDVASIVNGTNQALSQVRFAYLMQKSSELVQELKSLATNLLSSMEKEDGEALSLLRAKHEKTIFEMTERVKYGQLQEAKKSKEALLLSLASTLQRYEYYELNLGIHQSVISATLPTLSPLDVSSLEKLEYQSNEETMKFRKHSIDIAEDGSEGVKRAGVRSINNHEGHELGQLARAQEKHDDASIVTLVAKSLSLIPELSANGQPGGVGVSMQFGGSALSRAVSLGTDILTRQAAKATYEANLAAKLGSYGRREEDWRLQSNLATGEINQIQKQIRAAQIREAVAEMELKNHRQQMKHADETRRFLNEEGANRDGKKSNQALYAWMKREARGLYSQCFQLAYDIAQKAERALQHELGKPDLRFIQFDYMSGKEGLFAGEKLFLDLKRMEMAYQEQNEREYELTKHVSLLQVDPRALLELRLTGRCTVDLPESLFDMDGPGHYFRRIRHVAVSVPCVTGPYASVNCTLTMLKSSIRKSPTMAEGNQYGRQGSEDARFSDSFGSLSSIVTSSAQQDSGMFENSQGGERYMPFEYAGAISQWQIQLPANPSKGEPTQFDYESISDVILHIRYTAREGGDPLKSGAKAQILAELDANQAAGASRLFSVRHEFPGAWEALRTRPASAEGQHELVLPIREEHFPYWSKGRVRQLRRVDLLARSSAVTLEVAAIPDDEDAESATATLAKDAQLGEILVGKLSSVENLSPIGELRLSLDSNELEDLWLLVNWGDDNG